MGPAWPLWQREAITDNVTVRETSSSFSNDPSILENKPASSQKE